MISCVMPTYNQEKFIKQAIDSILAQTHMDFELIIVDDGSTDHTSAIIETYSDPRIKKIRKPNGGTGDALNLGFSYATGKYETWFASDNVLYQTAFERLAGFLDRMPHVDYVYANCDIGVMAADGLREESRKNLSQEVDQTWNREKLFKHYFLGIVWLWLRELREKAGPFQSEPCEDYDAVLRMADAGGRFAFLNENLGWFRRHKANMTNKIMKDPRTGGNPHFYSRLVQEKSRERLAKCKA